MACYANEINIEVLQKELNESKKTGSMDDVFGKYCKKKSQLIHCWTNFSTVVEQCLSERERQTLSLLTNLTETLLDFICYKDGDRLASEFRRRRSCFANCCVCDVSFVFSVHRRGRTKLSN